ncbi:MAG: hypothetical protein Q9167_002899 [Letrouitia subvulpina]
MSWCQVAAETMPPDSFIVGVDLSPIKPIPRTTTFQDDIKSDKCRASIRQHLKSWKVDTVLHDGAPNVGTAWVQDAFSQAELVLQALKLGTEFLREGGTFVSKIFRSKDYNALLWVLQQLFHKVDATKPPSSRNVSAEIFVICRGFKAPKRIDVRLLDPRFVFAELQDPTPNREAKVFNPEKKKRKREGYEEGDHTQFKEVSAAMFIQTDDPIAVLGDSNKINLEQNFGDDVALAALSKLPETTDEVRQCCSDLKVLGRKEFRTLLRWRLKVRKIFGLGAVDNVVQELGDTEISQITPMDEDLRIQEEIERLHEREGSKRKRERRRANAQKQKEINRMQMHMIHPREIGLEQTGPHGEDSMFSMKSVGKVDMLEKMPEAKIATNAQASEERNSEHDSEDESGNGDDELDRELDLMYAQYQERRAASSAMYRAKKARSEHESGSDDQINTDNGTSQHPEQTRIGSNESNESNEIWNNARPTGDRQVTHENLTARASHFFDQGVFKDVGALVESEDEHNDLVIQDHKSQDGGVNGYQDARQYSTLRDSTSSGESSPRSTEEAQEPEYFTSSSSISKDQKPLPPENAIHGSRMRDDRGDLLTADLSQEQHISEPEERAKSNRPVDIAIVTAEAMSLAQQVATNAKSTHELIDEGFNKRAFFDRDGLPDWFLDDESKHNQHQRPITAAGAAAIKQKLRALNARPIKKVREAKDRKRFKVAQRLEKLRKKSALIADEEGASEKDKAQQIARLMGRATKKKPKQQVKLVVAKGSNRGIAGRPRGVKGKYKIVDARLKKDARAQKRIEKNKKKKHH